MRRLFVGLVALFSSLPAFAGFTETTSFTPGTTTSLKVVGVEGAKVEVTIDGNARSDTIPAVFNTDDHDRFVLVTVTGADGTVWSKKIEIKTLQQTVLTLYSATEVATPAPGAPVGSYVGWVNNTTDRCSAEYLQAVKFDFVKNGQTLYTWELLPGYSQKNATIEAGHYDVRIFLSDGMQWVYNETQTMDVTADGWYVYRGC